MKKAAKRTGTVTTAVVTTSLLFAPLAMAATPGGGPCPGGGNPGQNGSCGGPIAIGVGGFRDAGAERIPDKINGFAGTFPSYTPIVSQDPLATPFTWSVAKDVPALEEQIRTNAQNGDQSVVITYSRGTLVAAQAQRNLSEGPDAPSTDSVVWYYIASPNTPDGGIYSRYPGLPIPGLAFDGALPETQYTSYMLYREYDPWADSPDDILNPLAALNSLLAIRYAHPDEYYDTVSQEDIDDSVNTVYTNSKGGTTVITRLPTRQLPLLGPLRELSAVFGLTDLTEPFMKLIEPTLKWGVDLGYDRTNDESVPTPATPGASLFRVPGALPQLPAAIQQGVEDAVNEATPDDTDPPPSDGGGGGDPSGGNGEGIDQMQSFSAPQQEQPEPEPEPEPEPQVESEQDDDSDDKKPETNVQKTGDGNKTEPGSVVKDDDDDDTSTTSPRKKPLTNIVKKVANSLSKLGKKPGDSNDDGGGDDGGKDDNGSSGSNDPYGGDT